MNRQFNGLGLLLGATLVAAFPASAATDETAHTAAAVMAVDEHWSQAEIHGDTSYLDQLLLPEYRSVSAGGHAIGKADILKGARLVGSSPTRQQQIRQYLQTHPFAESVALHGDTAVLTFYSPKLGAQRGITSSDIFVFENGRWHAIYSQHADPQKS